MSALPAQVKKQIERANELAAQLNAPPAPTDGAAPSPAPQPAPAATPAAPQPTAAAPEPAPAPSEWEQRYRVLQGKYNAEVPRLQTQNRELIAKVNEMQGQLVSMQAVLSTLGERRAAPSPAAPPAAERLVKDEEIKEFGADLIDVVKRAAREAVLPELDQRIEQRVRPVAQKVEQTEQVASAAVKRVAKNDEQAVYALLTERVPNWQELNTSDAFNDWLDMVDPYANRKRGELLLEAFNEHNGPRVVAFFQGYLKEHAAVTPPAPVPSPAAPAGAPQMRLDELVVPGAPKAGAAGAQDGAGKRIWSTAEIKQFYRDVQAGKYRSNLEKQKQLEADLFAAQKEGRIRP